MYIDIKPNNFVVELNGLKIIVSIKCSDKIVIDTKVVDVSNDRIYSKTHTEFTKGLLFKRGEVYDFLLGKSYKFRESLKHSHYDYYSWKLIEIFDNIYYEKFNKFDNISVFMNDQRVIIIYNYFGVPIKVSIQYKEQKKFSQIVKKIKKAFR